MLNGKNIFITGGTGSFGREYTKILLKKYNPKKIIEPPEQPLFNPPKTNI